MAETNLLIEKLTELISLQQNQLLAMSQPQNTPQTTIVSHEPTMHTNLIPIKLDGKNYPLWSQSVHMGLKACEKLSHILELPPSRANPAFNRWDIEDTIVKGWICNSLDKSLYGKFLKYPTAKEVWDAIATTFYDGSDSAQVYNLNKRVNQIKQVGRPIELYYNELQDLWLEIDFRRPNPMACTADIERFDKFLQESRVYTFLDGLDDKFDNERANVLQMTPFPTLEQAFARVRKEATRQGVMNGEVDTTQMVPAAMYSKSYKGVDKSHLKCTHCGMTKHTKDQCFKLVGYPDWFKERRKEKNIGSGRSHAVIAQAETTQLAQEAVKQGDGVISGRSDIPLSGGSNLSGENGENMVPRAWYQEKASNHPCASSTSVDNKGSARIVYSDGACNGLGKSTEWILDTGATDHMTFDKNDLINFKTPKKNGIINANGICYPVNMAGDVKICPNLTLQNTLFVPSLTSKLVSVGQLTK